MKKNFLIFLMLILILIGSFMMIIKQSTKDNLITIAFLGDSITQFGWEQEDGYVRQVVAKLYENGIKTNPIPAGICGDTSIAMLNRMDNDVLNYKPDIMFFMGGLNDIWLNQSSVEEYKNNITNILNKAEENNVKIILLNLTVIGEDINSSMNKQSDSYNEFLSTITKERHITLIDVNSEIKNEILKENKPNKNVLTTDGVHLNKKGNTILADTIVKKFLAEIK